MQKVGKQVLTKKSSKSWTWLAKWWTLVFRCLQIWPWACTKSSSNFWVTKSLTSRKTSSLRRLFSWFVKCSASSVWKKSGWKTMKCWRSVCLSKSSGPYLWLEIEKRRNSWVQAWRSPSSSLWQIFWGLFRPYPLNLGHHFCPGSQVWQQRWSQEISNIQWKRELVW